MQFSEHRYFPRTISSTPSTQIEAKSLEKEKKSTNSDAKAISITAMVGLVCLMMINLVYWVGSSENQIPSNPTESSSFIPKNPY